MFKTINGWEPIKMNQGEWYQKKFGIVGLIWLNNEIYA